MLVLSRKKNEKIVVSDTIVITVLEIRGGTIRLGIEAPRNVPIHRAELMPSLPPANQSVADAPDLADEVSLM